MFWMRSTHSLEGLWRYDAVWVVLTSYTMCVRSTRPVRGAEKLRKVNGTFLQVISHGKHLRHVTSKIEAMNNEHIFSERLLSIRRDLCWFWRAARFAFVRLDQCVAIRVYGRWTIFFTWSLSWRTSHTYCRWTTQNYKELWCVRSGP